jgi:CubicO group peptidase (beta-lactamase class C family)
LFPAITNKYTIMDHGRIKYLVLGVLILLSACGKRDTGQKSLLEHEGIRESFQKVFEQNELMGMSVLLIYDGKSVWEGYFGLADSLRRIPISERTRYRVASISKMVTATALLQLWEAGRVDLDADVSQYLGWPLKHPKHEKVPITLRHLMSHRSGIRDCDAYYNFSGKMIPEKLNIQELFLSNRKYFADDLFADHAPGKYFSYANCTWGLVATVVEKVSGERFDDYCRQHILQPLGMKADFNVAEIDSMNDIAVLYRFIDGKWTPQADDYQGKRPASRAFAAYEAGQNGLIFGPQGSLRASAQDLSRIAFMLMNDGTWNGHRILKKETVMTMLDEQWTNDGNNGDTGGDFFHSYGLAIHRTLNQDSSDMVFPDRRMTGHPGDAYGLLSGLYFEKKSKAGIVFITNGGKRITDKGVKTAFYKVEEDVYATAYQFLKKLESHFP